MRAEEVSRLFSLDEGARINRRAVWMGRWWRVVVQCCRVFPINVLVLVLLLLLLVVVMVVSISGEWVQTILLR